VKDPEKVLREKLAEVQQVRREIQALLTIIPLLADNEPSDGVKKSLENNGAEGRSDSGRADLERYYPFVRHLS
jgi:hypothetical protein